jgi:hypothetical protein
MANGYYEAGLRAFANGDIDWTNDDIRVTLVGTSYTPNLSTHDFYDDITNVIDDGAATIAGKGVTLAGVLDGTDDAFTAVTGTEVSYLVISKYNATASLRALLFLIDTAGANLPFTPNGSDVTIQWSDGAGKIAQL